MAPERPEDGAPDHVVGAARDAYAWLESKPASARLVDSAGSSASGVTFEGGGVTVSLDVSADGLRLTGRLQPPRAAKVEVLQPGGTAAVVEASDDGHLDMAKPGPGPLRLRVHLKGTEDATVDTQWFVV